MKTQSSEELMSLQKTLLPLVLNLEIAVLYKLCLRYIYFDDDYNIRLEQIDSSFELIHFFNWRTGIYSAKFKRFDRINKCTYVGQSEIWILGHLFSPGRFH